MDSKHVLKLYNVRKRVSFYIQKKLRQLGTQSCLILAIIFSTLIVLSVCGQYTQKIKSHHLHASKCIMKTKGNEASPEVLGTISARHPELIDHILHSCLDPPSGTKPRKTVKDPEYTLASKSLTWNFIHSFLVDLFQDEGPGFFVEAGALDGEMLSNTMWLEEKRNWTGLLIEPNPTNYRDLRKKSRNSWSAQSCLSTNLHPKIITLDIPSYGGIYEKTRYAWYAKGATYDLNEGYHIEETKSIGTYYHTYQNAQCFPLESFLVALNLSVIDFFSLDIQGGEYQVLVNFPWERIKIRALVVEHYNTKSYDSNSIDDEFVDIMGSKGYTLIGTSEEPDYFFVRKDDEKFAPIVDLIIKKNMELIKL